MKPFFKILLTFLLFIIFISCNGKNPTEPELQPGRRDYVWTVDTLKIPYGEYVSISNIWGANPNDLWVCGMASSNEYILWHYDGNRWINVNVGFLIFDASTLFGFNNNSIWLGTAHGVTAQYDGTKWNMVKDLSSKDENLIIQGIWGTSPTDLYAFGFWDRRDLTGYRGSILKYNGTSWSSINNEVMNNNFLFMGYDKLSKKYFISSYRSETGEKFIYELKGSQLIKLVGTKEETKIFNMNDRVYFMIGSKIYNYDSQQGLSLWKDFTSTAIYGAVLNGRNEKDIFTINWGGIGHFNGNDVTMLFPTDLWFQGSILLEKDIFIVARNFQKGINAIIHGKLKN